MLSVICRGVLAAVALVAVAAGAAHAGSYRVATCKADDLERDWAFGYMIHSPGMEIRRRCEPEGQGARGFFTASVVRGGGTHPAGARATAAIVAPAGASFTHVRWGGRIHRADCRYSVHVFADVPGGGEQARRPIDGFENGERCPGRRGSPKAGLNARYAPMSRSETTPIAGTTRIVQRVMCMGRARQPSCSARGSNYVRTDQLVVTVQDDTPPAVSIRTDTALTSGQWVSGKQTLNYHAVDNVGVRAATARIAEATQSSDRPCSRATSDGAYASVVPCPNGDGSVAIETMPVVDGLHALHVSVDDTAGNRAISQPVLVRIDNNAPVKVGVGVVGGDGWRSTPAFDVAWPVTAEHAPISVVRYRLCPAAGGACVEGDGGEPSRLGMSVAVPGPGEWRLSLWRGDAAGNISPAQASDAVSLRYDPEPPAVAFEAGSAAAPTVVSVAASDRLSGVAWGEVELSAQGSGTWQALATSVGDGRLTARIDDAALAPGVYAVRARARDRAGNEASTTTMRDGRAMTVALPLRATTQLTAGVVVRRVVRRRVTGVGGRREVVRRRVTEVRRSARLRHGRSVDVTGRLATGDGRGVGAAEVRVLARSAVAAEHVVAVLRSDAEGRFAYRAPAGTSRVLRFAYPGSEVTLPAAGEVGIVVAAGSSVRASRSRVLNGGLVRFSGRLATLPVAADGKLVELQARLSGGWQTFRTARTDAAGRWAIAYRFRRTRGLVRFDFRVQVPAETGYPFGLGASRRVSVFVRGV